jgi:hypothetical protein
VPEVLKKMVQSTRCRLEVMRTYSADCAIVDNAVSLANLSPDNSVNPQYGEFNVALQRFVQTHQIAMTGEHAQMKCTSIMEDDNPLICPEGAFYNFAMQVGDKIYNERVQKIVNSWVSEAMKALIKVNSFRTTIFKETQDDKVLPMLVIEPKWDDLLRSFGAFDSWEKLKTEAPFQSSPYTYFCKVLGNFVRNVNINAVTVKGDSMPCGTTDMNLALAHMY